MAKSADEYLSILSLDEDDLDDIQEELENVMEAWKGAANIHLSLIRFTSLDLKCLDLTSHR